MTSTPPTGYTLLTPHASPQLLPDTTRLGPVHLDVTDRENQRLFWTRYIGLTVIAESNDVIELGAGGETLIVLHPGATSPVAPRRTGLYHVAIHVPTQKDLARLCARLYGLGWEHSPTDHTETMATYTSDPDGNGIEITFETPERGSLARGEADYAAVLADGTVRRGTEPLDVDALLNALDDADDLMAPMPAATRIGHVHLHVNDIVAARQFYIEQIGLGDMRWFESFRMSDFSLATSYVPHALAINTWNGTTAQPRPDGSAGLREWQVVLPDSAALEALSQRLSAAVSIHTVEDSVLRVLDPAGNPLVVRVEGH